MTKIIRRFITKAEANKFKEQVMKLRIPGLTAQTFQRSGKYACMIATQQDMPEELYNELLGGHKNLAEEAK
jgi:hypothetical protein